MATDFARANNSCSATLLSEDLIHLRPTFLPTGKPLTYPQYEFLVSKGIDPEGVTYLAGGSEGQVFINSRTQMAMKFFASAYNFRHTIWLEQTLTAKIQQAGYKFTSSTKIDSVNLMIEHRLMGGLTIYHFTRENVHNNRERWQAAFNQHRRAFKKLRKALRQDPIFVDESRLGERGYFDLIDGFFKHEGETYYLNLHQDNILVTETSPGKFEFTIIDLR